MSRRLARIISIVLPLGLTAPVCYGQLDGLYEFDGGGDGTSWDDATNWEQVLDPNGLAISGDPATPPDGVTSADIPLAGVVIDNTMPGQTALDVRIGTVNGIGSLSITGGDLLAGRDVFVGRDDVNGVNGGTLNVSGGTLPAGDDITVGAGSAGTMTMSDGAASTGDDFFINADSSFTMTGGALTIGDRLTMNDNASLLVDGGQIVAADDFFFFGSSQVTVDSGSMITQDKLRFDDVSTDGKLTINGGLVRSNEFGFVDDSSNYILQGVLEINGDGIYQVEAPDDPDDPISQLSVAQAKALIAEGVHIITSEAGPLRLGVQTVIVPEYFGRTDVAFTQISVVPEPASLLLLGLAGLGLLLRRTRTS